VTFTNILRAGKKEVLYCLGGIFAMGAVRGEAFADTV
jgi:hypothetical protein